jgi:hypothetical protein
MRSLVWFITAAAAVFILATVVLPLLGMLLAVVVVVIGLAMIAYVAAPFLAKLPWFRDRIHVEQHGRSRTVRFGGTQFTSYTGSAQRPTREPWSDDPNVIDVEGRQVEVEVEEEQLPPPRRDG